MSISRHASYNLVGSLLPLLLALLTVPLYIGLIGTDRYGVLSIAFLFLGYFGLFDLGLGRATTYRLSALADAAPQERADAFWTALSLNVAMGLVGSVVLWIGAGVFFGSYFKADPALRSEIMASIPLLAVCLPVATLTGVLTGTLQARGRFLETNLISVSSTALFQLLPIAVAWFRGPDLSELLAAALCARFIGIVVLIWRCYREIGRGTRFRFARREVPLLMGFGGWILVDGLLSPVLGMVDRFAIGSVMGGTAVTIYTVPFQLAQRITIIPSALLSAVFPRLPAASPEQRLVFAERSIKVLLGAISVPVLVAVMAIHPFFELWLGPTIGGPSAQVGVLILVGFWINALGWAPLVWLQGVGRPDLVAKVHLFQVPPYLAALYFGLTQYGLWGVGVVLIVRNAIDLVALSIASGQSRSLAPVAGIATIFALAAIAAERLASFDPIRFAALVVLSLLMTWLSWRIMPIEVRAPIVRNLGARLWFG